MASRTLLDTKFGSITVDGKTYKHDVLIKLSGKIKKRKKKLSKQVYGTSHKISLEEARYIYEEGCTQIIIGTGHLDQVRLSEEASRFLTKKGVDCLLQPTPQAIETFENMEGAKVGLFHVTC